MKKEYIFCFIFALFFIPFTASANAGTPLIWATMFHASLGSIILGFIEGTILAKIYKINRRKAVSPLILGNIFSTFAGFPLLLWLASLFEIDIYNVNKVFFVMLLVAYIATLVLEFPFVVMCFWRDTKWFRRSIYGTLITQTASYILLLIWYWLPGGASPNINADLVNMSEMALPVGITIYYISDKDGDIYMQVLDKKEGKKIFDLKSYNPRDHLFVWESPEEKNRYDLFALKFKDHARKPEIITIKKSFTSFAAIYKTIMEDDRKSLESAVLYSFYNNVPKLGDARNSLWKFQTFNHVINFLSGHLSKPVTDVRLSAENMFWQFGASYGTHLPGDKVIFQFGKNQICVYDPVEKKLALFARGRGPIAVLDDSKK